MENGTDKYVVVGVDKKWQPLFDSDESGFFSAQAHVTPHIGFHGTPKLHASVNDFPTCPDPEYDHYEESLQVIEQLREVSGDTIKKQKIAFYDNKLMVINTVKNEVKRKLADTYSFEDEFCTLKACRRVNTKLL